MQSVKSQASSQSWAYYLMEETEHAANHEERPAQAELSMAGAGGHKQWDNPDSESLDRTWE